MVYRGFVDLRDLPVAELLLRMEGHPNSVVLAQAALESGWGTSRFLRGGNIIFGVWSLDPEEPRLEAGETRGGKRIFVKRYPCE